MFAKRYQNEDAALKNAKYNNDIVSYITSSEGSYVIVKFHNNQLKIIFYIPVNYPDGKLCPFFMNEVPDHPFYAKCTTETNLNTFFICNTILDYIISVKKSLDDVNTITNGVKNMTI